MHRILLVLLLSMTSNIIQAKAFQNNFKNDLELPVVIQNWFSGWKLVYQGLFQIDEINPVDLVFFDESFIYTTSKDNLNNPVKLDGYDLLNLELTWYRSAHNGQITLPDGSKMPIGISCFAAENQNKPKVPFFVMPLPSFWKQAGVESTELGLDNMLTGIFIHEFSHTQQMHNFGKLISKYEKMNITEGDFDDNVIQTLFEGNPEYVAIYMEETNLLYHLAESDDVSKESLSKVISLINQRHEKFFIEQPEVLKNVEGLFLTMEGLGQYAMYLWLSHPQGGNIKSSQAVNGVRRNKRWWSQDQGLALFLVLEKYLSAHNWISPMFGKEVILVTDLIKSGID